VGVDIDGGKLELARSVGAEATVDAGAGEDVVAAITDVTGGGAHVSLDALGAAETCRNSILCLRKRGRHVQVGLLPAAVGEPALPMYPVLSRELEIVGSYGMPANHYARVLDMIVEGKLEPRKLVGKTLPLEEAGAELEGMGSYSGVGIAVIDRF
jgi:alcohol dehydrogenase